MHYVYEPTNSLTSEVILHSITTKMCHSSIWAVAGTNLPLDTDFLEAFRRFVPVPPGKLHNNRPAFTFYSFQIHCNESEKL
jgi:hypothetical protein